MLLIYILFRFIQTCNLHKYCHRFKDKIVFFLSFLPLYLSVLPEAQELGERAFSFNSPSVTFSFQ